jgi:hypothetical protein
LITGPECGRQTIAAEISSWALPDQPVHLEGDYEIDESPAGSSCAPPEQRSFDPGFSAGTINPRAAALSPFVLRTSRGDAEQPLDRLTVTLPPGLSANVAAATLCPETTIAVVSSNERSGRSELAQPSCPAESRLGSAAVSAGAGSDPLSLVGSVYLGGPHAGAPYSLLVLVPVVAGPFDLGTIASRIDVAVDPSTLQPTLTTQPLPKILAGVPIALRSIRLSLDRPGFIRNPTSCAPTRIDAIAGSTSGTRARLVSRFQVGDCSELSFEPRLDLRFSGALGRNGHPELRAVLRAHPGDAGIAGVTFTLPPGELLDFRRIRALCARGAAAEACTGRSQIGVARVRSQAFPAPLEGPVYLRAPSEGLPDLLLDLRGGHLRVVLHGRIATPRGRIQVRLTDLPDVPISSAVIRLSGGRHGILVNSESRCVRPGRARVSFSAHSGATLSLRPRMRLGGRC